MPMATDDPIRASDADREVVVATLREAFTAGRLTQDEFGERMVAADDEMTPGHGGRGHGQIIVNPFSSRARPVIRPGDSPGDPNRIRTGVRGPGAGAVP